MSITINYLKGTATTSNASSYALGTCTPSGTAVLVLMGFLSDTVTSPGSATGWGLTWTAGTAFTYVGGANSGYLFYAVTDASPGNGTATIYCTGDNASGANVVLYEILGADTASTIRQIKTASGTAANATLTLGTAPLTINGLIGGYGVNKSSPAGTAPSGWSAANFNTGYSTPSSGAVTAANSTPDGGTVITFTAPASGTYGIITAEFNIKEYGYFIATMGAAALTASGNVINVSSGTLNSTLGNFTLSAAGTHGAEQYVSDVTVKYPSGVTGSLIKSLDAFTITASGTLTPIAFGTANLTTANMTLVSSGSAELKGYLSKTLDSFTINSAGSIPAFGTLIKTLSNFTLASSGSIECKGTLSSILSGFTLTSSGLVSNATASGDLSVTLSNYTLSSSGSADLKGYLAKTLSNFSLASGGSVEIKVILDRTLSNFSLASTGIQENEAELSRTLSNYTLISTGTVSSGPTASLSVALANFTLSASGTSIISGGLDKTLANASLVSSGSIPCNAALDKTLSNFTLVSTGTVNNGPTANLDITLANATLSATGSAPLTTNGYLDKTLASATLISTGISIIAGQLSKSIESLSISSTGTQEAKGILSATMANATLTASGVGIAFTLGQLIITLTGANMYAWGVVGKPFKQKYKPRRPIYVARNNIIYRRKKW